MLDPARFAQAVADVDLGAILRNADRLAARAHGAEVMAVVKADAYGHGSVAVARALAAHGVGRFAVATVPEAVALRAAGIEAPILVFSGSRPEFLPAYLDHGLDLTLASESMLEALEHHRPSASARLRVHVKIDTGMTRLGFRPRDAADVVRRLERMRGIEIEGLWTHFATADEPGEGSVHAQLERFRGVVGEVGDAARYVHVANSDALLRMPDAVAFDRPALVRPGVALYGLLSDEAAAREAGLEAAMRVTAPLVQVRKVDEGTAVSYGRRWRARRATRVGTVGAGYADGIPRLLSNQGTVGFDGRRYPIAGTVCMDMFMLDLGLDEGAPQEGDRVVLLGAGGPSAFELAAWAGTIPYEIVCGIASRVPRRHSGTAVGDSGSKYPVE